MRTAESWIEELNLLEHPEGGCYREVYRAPLEVAPEGFAGSRNICTHIYYLLEEGQVSRFHRIRSDELWHFYAGTALDVAILHNEGRAETLHLSADQPFGVVPARAWFGASIPRGGYALVGCTVAPGFDFSDFEMADREALLATFPAQAAVIHRLTS